MPQGRGKESSYDIQNYREGKGAKRKGKRGKEKGGKGKKGYFIFFSYFMLLLLNSK